MEPHLFTWMYMEVVYIVHQLFPGNQLRFQVILVLRALFYKIHFTL